MAKIENLTHFADDVEKMVDFKNLTKEEFLASYSYLTEKEYDMTVEYCISNKGFNKSGFYEWIENEFCINPFALELLDNIIEYAHKHEHVSKDQFAYFIADIVPEIEFLDVARYCDDTILTRSTLKELGRCD